MRKVIFEQARSLAAFTKPNYSQYGQSLYEVVHITFNIEEFLGGDNSILLEFS